MTQLTTDYQQQLNIKVGALQQQFETLFEASQSAPNELPNLEVFPSPPAHYRMRAEFRVWHEGDDLFYIMFHKGTRDKYRVDHFEPGSLLLNQLMTEVLQYVKDKPVLRSRLFQVDFLTTTTQQATISLLYHRQLDEEWQAAAEKMRADFQQFGTIELIGRARKQKLLVHNDRVIEQLDINGRVYQFEQIENSFTQPNAFVNTKMIEWALDCTRSETKEPADLVELYCGNGNFSLPLAQNFRRVLATEISRSSVQSAQTNIKLNQIDNVVIARMSAEEFSAAMEGSFQSKRVDDLELATYAFNTVLVDPPRAGIDNATLEMIAKYDRILYISCNPETLLENLTVLLKTHQIERTALFDQFPFTEHTEAGVYLVKNN